MSATVAQARLKDAHKGFVLRWERTREAWNDEARARVEKEYIEPLRQRVHTALGAMARLSEAITQTRQQCQ